MTDAEPVRSIIRGDYDYRPLSVNSENLKTNGPEPGEEKLVENLLSSQRVINALTKMVLDDKLQPPFTVGIYGDWGTGKTYFMQSMKETIDKRTVINPKPLTVMFEAWRYQAVENILISMLQCAYEELPEKVKRKRKLKSGFKAAMMAVAASLPELTVGLGNGLGFKVAPEKIVEKFRRLRAGYKQDKFLEKQAQVKLHAHFKDIIDMLAKYDDSKNHIDDGQPKRRIIFFIDDLDRCLPEKVVDLLEKIKLFLWHPNCVFVIGIDQNQVKNAVARHGGYTDEDALLYLEKIINFPFHMPPVSYESYKDFIEGKLPDYGCKGDIVAIFAAACDERQASLRLITQLCNIFILNDHLVSYGVESSGKEYKPKIMAVLTALQVLRHDAFSKICGKRGNRKHNLEAFFCKAESAADATSAVLSSDSLSEMKNLKAAAENAGFDKEKDDLPSYVEFMMAQSSESRPERIHPVIGSEKDGMTWYAKDLPALPSSRAKNSLKAIVAGIINGDIATGSILEIDGYHWRLLHNDNNEKALLITEYIIGRSYLDKPNSWAGYKYDWEKCMLNQELNSGEWLEEHLPLLSQKDLLIETKAGQETLDKVFLLSKEETESHFKADSDRTAVLLGTNTGYWWWLRSPRSNASNAAGVSGVGSVRARGNFVNDHGAGVRPALWLNLTSGIFES